jgi:hypothetical protein
MSVATIQMADTKAAVRLSRRRKAWPVCLEPALSECLAGKQQCYRNLEQPCLVACLRSDGVVVAVHSELESLVADVEGLCDATTYRDCPDLLSCQVAEHCWDPAGHAIIRYGYLFRGLSQA